MRRLTCLWAGVALLAVFAANRDVQAQTTWYVDDDAPGDPGPGDPALSDPLENGTLEHPFDAIQEGIDAAGKGDTVLVRDGTYTGTGNKDLDYGGKAITVRSENGPGATTIDCEGEGRGFLFANGEGASAVVDGLTITNGSVAGNGGGVYCRDSSPTIANCIITENESRSHGGGIACVRSAATILNCTIRVNMARDGAGVSCFNESSPTIMDCAISENTSNSAGGILIQSSSAPMIVRCVIARNKALWDGGGILCDNSAATIRNCLIVENTATQRGGGIFSWASARLTITNVTIVANSARDGGALAFDSFSNRPSFVEVSNSILWSGSGGVWNNDGSTIAITHCNVEGGWPGMGNLDTDPRFALSEDYHLVPVSPGIDAGTNDPPGGLPDDDLDGNLRPLDGNGNGLAVADMGAYEFNPALPCFALSPNSPEFLAPAGGPNPDDQILSIRNCGGGTLDWRVSDDCAWLEARPASGSSVGEVDRVALSVDTSGLSPGSYVCTLTLSAAKAINTPRTVRVTLHVNTPRHVPAVYPTIQAGIDAAISGDHVIVADGIFTGVGNREIDLHGKAIVVRSENGPQSCIIDIGSYAWGFWFQTGETSRSIVDGFTIRNGRGGIHFINNSNPIIRNCLITANIGDGGGGVFCRNSSPTISNCTITGNRAIGPGVGRGGGIWGQSSRASIVGCVITDNTAYGGGGGILFTDSSPTISFCTISRNSVGRGGLGGGIYCYVGNPVIKNCEITRNTIPEGNGGGIYVRECVARISECVITGNDIDGSFGGGIYSDSSDTTIVQCLIAGNTAGTGGGGGVAGTGVGPLRRSVTISRSTVAGNSASEGGGIFCSSFLTLTDSLIIGNVAGSSGGVRLAGFIGSTLTRCVITGNTATSSAGGLRIAAYSFPTVDNCVITQNSAAQQGGGIYWDRFSRPSISNCTIAGNSANVNAGGVYGHPESRATITNGIIASNEAPSAPEIWVPPETLVTYTCVQGGWPGAGNINADPQFVDPENGDFHLLPASPCIDRGDPAFIAQNGETDIDRQMRVWNGRVDMGADEFGSFVFGDMNCDDRFNGGDIDPFFLALGDPLAYAKQLPNCEALLGDMNADGLVNGGDIDLFFDRLAGNNCGVIVINQQPQGQDLCVGNTLTLSVDASGSNLSFQWRKDGTDIAGATQRTYRINAVTPQDAGTYEVLITNPCGVGLSDSATITVVDLIFTHPVSQTVCENDPVLFSVTAIGQSLTYQWRKDGVDIPGATSSLFIIPAAQMSDGGVYDVVVTSSQCAQISEPATLTVQQCP